MIECIFSLISLCGAIHDRPVMILAGAEAVTASIDYAATMRGVGRDGRYEADPIVRPFVAHRATIVLLESLELAGYAMIAERARKSRHRVIRRTWWMWQGVPIALHVYGRATWFSEPKKCQGAYYRMGGACNE